MVFRIEHRLVVDTAPTNVKELANAGDPGLLTPFAARYQAIVVIPDDGVEADGTHVHMYNASRNRGLLSCFRMVLMG